jgi:glycosyltransferase involved in cell wall biosynthesis
MKFSLIHPSRERAERSFQVLQQYRDTFSKENEMEVIISLDMDDPEGKKYYELHNRSSDVKITSNHNKTYVEALNVAASFATGDVLIASADDFVFPPRWDANLKHVIPENKPEFVIWVADGIQPRIMTLPILSMAYYKRFGYIYFPEYISMYADNDFTEVAKKLGVVIQAQHIPFRHMHFSLGLMPEDATARRQNAQASYLHGEKLFNRRIAANFGLKV